MSQPRLAALHAASTGRGDPRRPADRPTGWTIAARGDLIGQGRWHLRQKGEIADIRFDWRVAAGKPLLSPLTPLLWPVLAANHNWAMARGLEGLKRRLARSQA
ncbi:hypothetical protein ACFMPD_04765 [Sedimentitalea sp. HM32M-2]|uniref:hypothetical protein n=1 Tax=Sedimentitalea sp. HM32M-2 TaxID=3351566 RepID=UPI00363E70EE